MHDIGRRRQAISPTRDPDQQSFLWYMVLSLSSMPSMITMLLVDAYRTSAAFLPVSSLEEQLRGLDSCWYMTPQPSTFPDLPVPPEGRHREAWGRVRYGKLPETAGRFS